MYTNSNDTRPSIRGQLLVGRQSPELRETLWELIGEAKGGDPLAPVTVVGPSSYVNLSLRQDLGRCNFANVRFIVMPVLSELLGGAALARTGRKPLPAVLLSVLVREVLAEATGPLASVRHHPATQASVRASFGELRQVGEKVLNVLAARGHVRADVVRLYREFRRKTGSEWYDSEDLAETAASAVHRDDVPGLEDLGSIVFYLPRDVSPAETKLMDALAQRQRCSVLLGTTGDAEADRPVRALARALIPLLGQPETAGQNHDKLPLLPNEARLHVAPNAHQELRWVIRRIVREAGEAGIPFHRMAVLYRMDNPYASLILDELRMADIPVAGPDRSTLADSAVGRALTGLLAMSGSDFRRADVMSWLTGCPIRPAGGRASGFNPSRWDSLTRKAGIVRGMDQWRDRLNLYAERLSEDAARLAGAEEITEARAERMKSEAAAAREALAFIEKLAEDVEPPVNRSTWGAFCRWADELLDRYLDRDIPDAEVAVLEKIRLALEELEAAVSINPGATLDEFRQTVEDSLGKTVGHLGVTGRGVFVSPVGGAAGMSFDRVWLVGMIEGGMPPPVRPDPLLPEPDWQAAGGHSRFAQRVAAERCDYLSAVATSPHRELSYPVADPASNRKAYPSRWYLEQASHLEGSPVESDSLRKLRDRPWLTVDDSAEHALIGADEASLADRHDYNLHRLLRWRHVGRRVPDHPFMQDETLSRATRLSLCRNQSRLTEYDGNLSSLAGEGGFHRKLRRAPVSATSLENWGTCPFRYFLGHVLRLGALETPEETTSITPLERGSLIHRILERFMKQVNEEKLLPAPGEEWSDTLRGRLFRIAGEEFSLAESRGVTGKPLLWKLEKQDILTDLETFFEEDSKLRSFHGTRGVLVEAGFGSGGGVPDVEDPETGIRFRGYIDRIDVGMDGGSVLVIDYKTGGASAYKGLKDDPIDGGRRLQLGVYSLAARRFLTDATELKAAYWFVTTRGGFGFHPPDYFDIHDAGVRERFRVGLSTVVSGITGGVFPANPGPDRYDGPENCKFCDFDSLCAARRTDQWARMKSDPIVSGYVALAEGSGEEGQ